MANNENLKPIKKGELTKEEAKRRGSNGGKKSVQVRREKKLMRQVAEETLLKLMPNGQSFQEQAFERLQESLLNDYIKPQDFVKILEFLRDTAGQKPIDKQLNVEGTKEDLEIVIDKKGIQAEIEKTRQLADE